MENITGASLECELCDCRRTYTGTLTVGDAACECKHPLKRHRIITHASFADPRTGMMSADFEIAPSFR